MSSGQEATLWKYISKNLAGKGVDLTRVESHATAVGVPDVNCCIDGVDSWAELKFNTTKGLVLRDSQFAWMRRRLACGANNIYIIWGADIEYTDERGMQRVYGLIKTTTKDQLQWLRENKSPVCWASRSVRQWAKSIDFKELRTLLS